LLCLFAVGFVEESRRYLVMIDQASQKNFSFLRPFYFTPQNL